MSWTHLSDTRPRARKQHQCILCRLRIRKGARHVHRTGVVDGELVSSRMHAVCEAATRDWDDDAWDCHADQEFREYNLRLPILSFGHRHT